MDVPDPAWPLIQEWVAGACVEVEVLPADAARGEKQLESLQVTARSTLGAIALNTGGLLVDGGWLRVFGAGHARLPLTIADMTGELGWASSDGPPPALAIGVDVLGGVWAMNGGAIASHAPGGVFFFDLRSLEWIDLGVGYTDWIRAILCTGGLAKIYEPYRWTGWREDIRGLGPSEGIGVYPHLWTTEGGSIERASRKTTPLSELVSLHFGMGR